MSLTIDEMYLLEDLRDWDYIESEEGLAVRYDFKGGNLSLWIYKSGTAEGHCPKSLKKELENSNIDTNALIYV